MKTKGRRRLRLAGLVAGAAATVVVGAYLYAPVASADVSGTYASPYNASDPFIMKCFDRDTGQNGYCMYTSQDLGVAGPAGNPYPMENTLGFFSTDGRNWVPKGVIFSEDQLRLEGNKHLWAPAALQHNGDTYLLVPDVTSVSLPDPVHPWTTPNVHTSSQIHLVVPFAGVGPFGPFFGHQIVTDESGNVPGYMSDPEPFQDSTGRYLLWANGDGDTCGGLSMGRLADSLQVVTQIQELTITGFPSDWGTCSYKFPFANKEGHGTSPPGNNRPYLEGASLFKFSDMTTRTGLPGPYTLVFAAKPTQAPGECQKYLQPNTANEVIAYATSSSVTGPYAYQGILMCGSSTEFTNQATIAEIATAGGAKRMVLVYHDGPAGSIHNRKLHAECLWFGAGTFAMATRTSTGFNDCMNGANSNAWAFRSRVFPPGLPQNVVNAFGVVAADVDRGGGLYANRAAVGPWEMFEVRDSNGNIIGSETIGPGPHWNMSIRAYANNRIVTSASGTGDLIANRMTAQQTERFRLYVNGLGRVSFASGYSGLEVTTHASGRTLRPTNPARAPDEFFDILHL